jgi:hypothetical protein
MTYLFIKAQKKLIKSIFTHNNPELESVQDIKAPLKISSSAITGNVISKFCYRT